MCCDGVKIALNLANKLGDTSGYEENIAKRIFFGLSAIVAAALLSIAPVSAQESLRSPVLKQYEDKGGTVDFIGSAHGLDGWVVKDSKGDVKTTVYTMPDGAMVSGMLFSADGTSETQKQLEAYHNRFTGSQDAAPGAEKSLSKSEKLYAETEKAGWVRMGNSTVPYIYVFMNVNCDHCQNYWKDLESAIKNGTLQVRLVPYGASSENRDGGAALLSVDTPEEAWNSYIAGDNSALSKDKIKEGSYQKIDTNTAMVKSWKLAGPPFTLYRRPGDGLLTAIIGRPENIMLLLAEFLK